MSCAVCKAVWEFTFGLACLLGALAAVTVLPVALFLLGVLLGGEGPGSFLFFMIGLVAGCNIAPHLTD